MKIKFFAICLVISSLVFTQALMLEDGQDILESITVAGNDPADYVVPPGGQFDGVTFLTINKPSVGSFNCSGSLLTTGRHILTAAHCVTDTDNGGLLIPGTNVNTRFQTEGGTTNIVSSNIFVHPDWNGDANNGHDIAIVELASLAPADAERYDILRDTSVFNVVQTVDIAGYGTTGTGANGFQSGSQGTLRTGLNRIEAVDGNAGTLFYDFDNGEIANDTLGLATGLFHQGFGDDEVFATPGDSGGPAFIGNLVAGVNSFFTKLSFGDIDNELNGTFGEIGALSSTSHNAAFIDSVTGTSVPEPSSYLLMFISVALFGYSRKKNKKIVSKRGLASHSKPVTKFILRSNFITGSYKPFFIKQWSINQCTLRVTTQQLSYLLT